MKMIFAAVALLLVATTAADAQSRRRITVQPQGRVIAEHPRAVEYALSYMLCAFHVFSIGPNQKPAECASWFFYPTQNRRRV